MARAAERIASDPLSAGWARLAEGEWGPAKASFESALAGEESPEALKGLSWAAWWLDDATPCAQLALGDLAAVPLRLTHQLESPSALRGRSHTTSSIASPATNMPRPAFGVNKPGTEGDKPAFL